jgi:AcrR family transcriptional regulator
MKKTQAKEIVQRTALRREIVLRAALEMADESGIQGFSLRLLAKRLGVEAMSLYNHVANKDDIIDGMLEIVVGEIRIPEEDEDWRIAMKERALSASLAFRRHPWASALIDSRISSKPAVLRYYNAIIGILCRAGFSLEQSARAFSLLDCYIYGFGIQKSNLSADDDASLEEKAGSYEEMLPDGQYPYLRRIAALASEKGYDQDADFEFGINLILEGLGKLLAPLTP